MTSYNRDGRVGPWAAEKLDFLGKYLAAYTTILRKQARWCKEFIYIDAFAGAGRSEVRSSNQSDVTAEDLLFEVSEFGREDEEAKTYIDGSPYVALDIEHPFSKYFFIEKSPERVQRLRGIQDEYLQRRSVEIIRGDAKQAIPNIITNPEIDWRSSRAVIFLDPFGMQVSWNTIRTIAETRAIEIILNFPVGMAIQRLLPTSGSFTDEQKLRLSDYFGSPDWEEVVYRQSMNLFGETEISKVEKSGERLVAWYRERLKNVFGFAPLPRLIRNSKGGHLYYLLFAGPNKTGAKIASEVFLRQGQLIRSTGR